MPDTSRAFELLDERVRRWIWQQGWNELRDAQEQAIAPILNGTQDVIISAATAAGKTEAAFLPIASCLLNAQEPGLVIYLSPLKALINDQFLRLGDFFGSLDLPVYPWHGDVGPKVKSDFEKNPQGALLITPESLEGIFVRKGFYIPVIFRYLRYVVVDEMHSFIGRERGIQVSSLLNRMEQAIGRRVPRVGLSATLGDPQLAAAYLRPHDAQAVKIIESKSGQQELRVLVKGYRESLVRPVEADDDDDASLITLGRVAADMFKAMRGSKNLVFANSRKMVEEFTDRMARIYEGHRLPNEFHAHHGSLAKGLRESVEALLKDPAMPATAVCTSTLEMGIDIGTVKSVGQISPPFSVASLRQRLGRSGRRGEPSILRAFVMESGSDAHPLQQRLRLDLLQTIACVELLLQRWCEPPIAGSLHLSTLIQQLLSLIAQKGGVRAEEAHLTLCRQGPFTVDVPRFTALLRALAEKRLLIQSEDGTLLHGELGEKLVNHYSFYATFWSAEEYRLVHGVRSLGTLSFSQPVAEKSLILFAGRRWRVASVDEQARVIAVTPAQGGRAPKFSGTGVGQVHERIHQQMFDLYRSEAIPAYLDQEAWSLLGGGRELFGRHELSTANLVAVPDGTLLFLWAGDRVANTVLAVLQAAGFSVETFGVGLMVEDVDPAALRGHLKKCLAEGPPSAGRLAESVSNQILEKYDEYLPPSLLAEGYGASSLAPEEAWISLRKAMEGNLFQPPTV